MGFCEDADESLKLNLLEGAWCRKKVQNFDWKT
jgi:hypothetical protein